MSTKKVRDRKGKVKSTQADRHKREIDQLWDEIRKGRASALQFEKRLSEAQAEVRALQRANERCAQVAQENDRLLHLTADLAQSILFDRRLHARQLREAKKRSPKTAP